MSAGGTSPQVVVAALGVPVGIPATGATAERLRRQWSRALTDAPARTVVDLGSLDASDEVAHDYAVTSRVTLAALDATRGTRLNLHAGVVADPAGRAISLVGASGSGKTTAVHHLARRLGYLSDETTSLDDDLRVHPHPKPLSVITDPAAPLAKSSLSPDDLDLVTPPASARLHRLVLLRRGPDDDGLRPLPPAHAIAEVVAQTSSLALLPHPLLRLAETFDAVGGVWELRYTEVEHWLDALVDLLDAAPQPAYARTHHPGTHPGTHPAADPTPAPVPGAWSRVPWHDAVEFDEELVVMVGAQVHVLAGLGVALWLALATPRPASELLAEVTAAWGPHPDAARLVEEALEMLAGEGMLVRPAPVTGQTPG